MVYTRIIIFHDRGVAATCVSMKFDNYQFCNLIGAAKPVIGLHVATSVTRPSIALRARGCGSARLTFHAHWVTDYLGFKADRSLGS